MTISKNLYCSVQDVQSAGGVSNISDFDLMTIINNACQEIDSYLLRYDMSGGNVPAINTAAIYLSQAGCYQRLWQDGTSPKLIREGTMMVQNDPETAIKILRAEAYRVLDDYRDSQIVRVHIRHRFVVRAN